MERKREESDFSAIQERNKKQYGNYNPGRRKARANVSQFREGPVPIEEFQGTGAIDITTHQLDSDLEDNVDSEQHLKSNESLPGSRGLLTYFSRLSKSVEREVVDFYFVETLLQAGANVNFTDRHGQSILHAVAKDWHPDVANFLIERGADVNLADKYGRTPLHVAAVYDHVKMVEFLVEKGGNIGAKTYGEMQTVVHYAAKKNSHLSLKALLRLGGEINSRDYKSRTPLFLAAELGRCETVKFLLEYGAPAGVYDSSGTSAIAVMVEKMPENARMALDQFLMIDGALRKSYYYLNYLEQDSKKQKVIHKQPAKTPLELIVLYKELDLITNPVIQKLTTVKWNMFGFKYTMITLLINLLYTLLWTILGFSLPRKGTFYGDLKAASWKIAFECIIIILTLYFIFKQIISMKNLQKNYGQWKDWKVRDIERDLNYCHPRYPDERRFLMNEIQRLRDFKGGYFQSFWNIFEWLCLISIITLMATRSAYSYLYSKNEADARLSKLLHGHKIVFALTLLFVWLRMMRVLRGFMFLAAFITLLRHVASETLKFTFLFFEFFIPYVCAFWMIFGGEENVATFVGAGDDANYFKTIQQTAMTVWTLTMIGDHPYQGMVAVDEILAQVLVASYWALVSLVCVNLYIALMSETFSRVYANAQANGKLEQASLLLGFEEGLGYKERKRVARHFKRQCNPMEEFSADSGKGSRDADAMFNMLDLLNKQIDRMQNVVGATNTEMERNQDYMDETLKDMQDDITSVQTTLKILRHQQQEILEHLKTSGIRKMVSTGGEALDLIKYRFGKFISPKNSGDGNESPALTDASQSDNTEECQNEERAHDEKSLNAQKEKRLVRKRKTLSRANSEPSHLDKVD